MRFLFLLWGKTLSGLFFFHPQRKYKVLIGEILWTIEKRKKLVLQAVFGRYLVVQYFHSESLVFLRGKGGNRAAMHYEPMLPLFAYRLWNAPAIRNCSEAISPLSLYFNI